VRRATTGLPERRQGTRDAGKLRANSIPCLLQFSENRGNCGHENIVALRLFSGRIVSGLLS